MAYRPRRSSKKWLADAPDYVLACYDNGDETLDRFTVLFGGDLWCPEMGRNVQALHLSPYPEWPMGVSMWAEVLAHDRRRFGEHIRWLDLPGNVRDHIKMRATE